jgi:hypothetical protein
VDEWSIGRMRISPSKENAFLIRTAASPFRLCCCSRYIDDLSYAAAFLSIYRIEESTTVYNLLLGKFVTLHQRHNMKKILIAFTLLIFVYGNTAAQSAEETLVNLS